MTEEEKAEEKQDETKEKAEEKQDETKEKVCFTEKLTLDPIIFALLSPDTFENVFFGGKSKKL